MMEFLSLFLKEHDSDADIVPYFLLRLEGMLGDSDVHSLLPLPAFRKSLNVSEAEGKKQIQSAKAALSLLCLVTGVRIWLVFKSLEAH